jgi:hypothetical protein
MGAMAVNATHGVLEILLGHIDGARIACPLQISGWVGITHVGPFQDRIGRLAGQTDREEIEKKKEV